MELNTTFREDLSLSFGDISGISQMTRKVSTFLTSFFTRNDDDDVQVTPPPPSPASPPKRAAAPARKRARMLSTLCSNIATPAPKRARLSSPPCSVSHSVTKWQTFSLHEKKQGLVKLDENYDDFDDLPNI